MQPLLFNWLRIGGLLLIAALGSTGQKTADLGWLEGHLHITVSRGAEPTDAAPPVLTPQTYAEYPLVVLTPNREQVVARFTADANGNYRATLPPGQYVLDVQDRVRKHLRAKPQPFTVTSHETVHVDMEMDTGIRE